MEAIRASYRALRDDDNGVAAVEYGLIAALIVIAMLGGLNQLATSTTDMWDQIAIAVTSS